MYLGHIHQSVIFANKTLPNLVRHEFHNVVTMLQRAARLRTRVSCWTPPEVWDP